MSTIIINQNIGDMTILKTMARECYAGINMDIGCVVKRLCDQALSFEFRYLWFIVLMPFVARWFLLFMRWCDKRYMIEHEGKSMFVLIKLNKYFDWGFDGFDDLKRWVMWLASFVTQICAVMVLYLLGAFNFLLRFFN